MEAVTKKNKTRQHKKVAITSARGEALPKESLTLNPNLRQQRHMGNQTLRRIQESKDNSLGKIDNHNTSPQTPQKVTRRPSLNKYSPAFHKKMMIVKPDDKLEQEAESIADKVMAIGHIERPTRSSQTSELEHLNNDKMTSKPLPMVFPVNRFILREKEQKTPPIFGNKTTLKPTNHTHNLTSNFSKRLRARCSKGTSLSDSAADFFESRFDVDFSSVKLHSDPEANEMARLISARAFTYNQDIYFAANQLNSESAPGRHLMAHELTHVLQNSNANGNTAIIQRDPDPTQVNYLPDVEYVVINHRTLQLIVGGVRAGLLMIRGEGDIRQEVDIFEQSNVAVPLAEDVDIDVEPEVRLYLRRREGIEIEYREREGWSRIFTARRRNRRLGISDIRLSITQGSLAPAWGEPIQQRERPSASVPEVATDGIEDMRPDANAVEGIHLYPVVESSVLRRADGVDLGDFEIIGTYSLVPQINRLPGGIRTIVYYLAYNQRTRRNEYVVGANQIDQFRSQINVYSNVAAISYLGVPNGRQPPEYVVESWRAQTAFLQGDFAGYEQHRSQAWDALTPDREQFFQGIITELRELQSIEIGRLRRRAIGIEDEAQRERALLDVRVLEAISEIVLRLILAVVGMVSGFVEGVISLVVGLFNLLVGIMKGILLFLYGFYDGGERFNRWGREVGQALDNIPNGLRELFNNWSTEFEQASEDRQTIMIGELTGEVLALLATFGAAASRAGAAPNIVASLEGGSPRLALVGAGELAPSAVGVSVDVASPALAAGLIAVQMGRLPDELQGPGSTEEAIADLEETVERGSRSQSRGRSTDYTRERRRRGSREPQRAIAEETLSAEAGRAIEASEILIWEGELGSGFRVIRNADFPQWVQDIFPFRQGAVREGPDLIAINVEERLILVGDVTAQPGQTVARQFARQESILHLERTIEHGQRVAAGLPEAFQGFTVEVQERYWQLLGELTRRIPVH